MLEAIIGSGTREKILLFLANYDECYARQVARTYGLPLGMVQRQLQRLEEGGVLVSVLKGKTRLFTWNPRYAFKRSLVALLADVLESLPIDEIRRIYRQRRRPRGAGKAL